MPYEMAFVPSHFEVSYTIETEEPERFQTLFNGGFICFDVSTALAPPGGVPCWSLFSNARRPCWTGLSDGFRIVRTWLLHPDSKKLIWETEAPPRSLVSYTTVAPDGAANALPDRPFNEDDSPTTGGRVWREYYDEQQRRPYYHTPEAAAQWEAPLGGILAPDHEAKIPTAQVETFINGGRRILPVQSGTDVAAAATAFCRANVIFDGQCAEQVGAQIVQSKASECDFPTSKKASSRPRARRRK